MAAADSALLYFETAYESGDPGNTSDFLVDDIVVTVQDPLPGAGPHADQGHGRLPDRRRRSTAASRPGRASELLLRHFDQVTSENYMKPEAWYDADKTFRRTPRPTRS